MAQPASNSKATQLHTILKFSYILIKLFFIPVMAAVCVLIVVASILLKGLLHHLGQRKRSIGAMADNATKRQARRIASVAISLGHKRDLRLNSPLAQPNSDTEAGRLTFSPC
uniref:Uncharacterized protein n=1 Tax=Oryza nivara TaxID=4536 RepID=A0A0E0FM91_ORYNI